MMRGRAVSHVTATLLLILIAATAAAATHAWLTGYASLHASMWSAEQTRVLLRYEGAEKLPSGGLRVYLRNVGGAPTVVDMVYVYDSSGSNLLFAEECSLELGPGESGHVTIPALKIAQAGLQGATSALLAVSSRSGVSAFRGVVARILLVPEKPTLLALRAYRYSEARSHWVVFDYNTGRYRLYDLTDGSLRGPYPGVAPLLEGVDEYTILEEWVPWGQRPVDSPIVIVVNPRNALDDWAFSWNDPHGTHRFYLEALGGDVEIDFLVFWEDLFNPYSPPGSVDDWKDHVVRVTVFTNGTYRIAVFMAKGGYKHEFYLDVAGEAPLSGGLVYAKPFGAYWYNRVGGYYHEMGGRVFYRTP